MTFSCPPSHKVTLAITGASGTLYAFRLLKSLVESGAEVFLLLSGAAFSVAEIETGQILPEDKDLLMEWVQEKFKSKPGQIRIFGKNEWTSPVASGSSHPRKMVICPASMGTLSAIATGASNNLIERAADVALKERRKLILVPRETPYSEIHLEHMLKLTRIGAIIMPASPGLYQKPNTVEDMIDFVVARILQHLDIPQNLMEKWGDSYNS